MSRVRGGGAAPEIEALTDLARSEGYEIVTARLNKILANLQHELIYSSSWDATLKLQGQIEATLRARSLPEIIAKELAGRLAK